MLAFLEFGVVGYKEFFQNCNRDINEIKKVVSIPAVTPAALSGKWRLLSK